MITYAQQRNDRIRKDYQNKIAYFRRIGVKHPGKRALEELHRKYGALRLTFDTFTKICRDPTYGQATEPPEQGTEQENTPSPDGTDQGKTPSPSDDPVKRVLEIGSEATVRVAGKGRDA